MSTTATIHSQFAPFVTTGDGGTSYMAGLPGYPRNFSRDTIIAGLIAADPHLLASQLNISTLHQGRHDDPLTGEEPGKIHHEWPGVMVNAPYLTTYDGCDTTALYLIGLEAWWHADRAGARAFLGHQRPSLEAAVAYLQRHIAPDDLFWEFPPPGAERFSLRTTYWKDSIVPSADGREEPAYPVAFALVQFQVARGLLSAATLLGRPELRDQADRLYRAGIRTFMTPEAFCVEQDRTGRLEQPSSDELHALAYLPAEYAAELPLAALQNRARPLITPAGLACTPQSIAAHLRDGYHGYVVWVFEQALMHYGCHKFGLTDLADVARRCVPHIGQGQELLSVVPKVGPLGNDRQLWSVAAEIYFSGHSSLRHATWL